MDTKAALNLLKKQRSDNADAIKALATVIETEKRALTDDERKRLGEMKTRDTELSERIDLLETTELAMARANVPEQRRSAPVQPGYQPDIRVVDPIRLPCRRGRGSKFYNDEEAYRAGRWVQGVLLGDPQARQWCVDNGVGGPELRAMGSNDFTKGGALVADELASAIIAYREERGVFRRYARVVPMSEAAMDWPKRTGGLTAYPVSQNNSSAITASDATFGQVGLVAKEWGTLSKVSRVLAEDAVIAIAEYVAEESGYAFADAEDKAGFLGDGTSTYHGIHGIFDKINDGNHAGSIVTTDSGDTSFGALDLDDFEDCVGKLPMYARNGACWFISQAGWASSMLRLLNAAGGNAKGDLQTGAGYQFLGYPVVISQVLNSTLSTQTSTILLLFGNLRMAALLGDKRGFNMLVLRERYAELSQIGLFGTCRFDINNHDLGDSSTAGSMLALKTYSS